MPENFEPKPSPHSDLRCSAVTTWGPCFQLWWTESEAGLCRSHELWRMRGVTPDPSYEKKIAMGLIQPTWEYLTDSEAEATINGRYRGDGRRLDQFVTDEPMMLESVPLAEILKVEGT